MNEEVQTGKPVVFPVLVEKKAPKSGVASIFSKPLSISSFSSFILHPSSFFLLGFLALITVAVLAVAIGSVFIPPVSILKILAVQVLPTGWVDVSSILPADAVVIWQLRMPRVVVAALVGASLGLVGAQMQGLFRNPLASPDITGTSAGGAFGAVVAIAAGLSVRSMFYIPLFSFIGSFATLFFVYAIATRRGRTPVSTLLLAGVAVSALIGALTSLVISMAWVKWEVGQEITFWLMGGLDSRLWSHVLLILPCFLIGALIATIHARELDILLSGEETARSLGVDIETVKRTVLVGAALLTGGAVAVSGVVGFIGLVVPHIVRLLIGPKHRKLLPASALLGAILVIVADLLARTLNHPQEIRLGIVTAVIGAPFFLHLLLKREA